MADPNLVYNPLLSGVGIGPHYGIQESNGSLGIHVRKIGPNTMHGITNEHVVAIARTGGDGVEAQPGQPVGGVIMCVLHFLGVILIAFVHN